MNAKNLLLVGLVFGLISCGKESDTPETPVNPHSFVAMRLRDMRIHNLPSPYFHFSYTHDKHINTFDIGNGLPYDITYKGGNITLMSNYISGGRDSVKYYYTDDKLIGIDVIDDAAQHRRASLTYYTSGQLQKLEWEKMLIDQSYTQDRSLTFTYYPDGNVKEIEHHFFPIDLQPETTFIDKFENYDNKKNVDGFTLVHQDKFPPILMPGITLQINNAGRVVRTGGASVTFEVNYTYTYDNIGRPLVKTGDLVNTSGPDAGKHSEVKTTFAYYKWL